MDISFLKNLLGLACLHTNLPEPKVVFLIAKIGAASKLDTPLAVLVVKIPADEL